VNEGKAASTDRSILDKSDSNNRKLDQSVQSHQPPKQLPENTTYISGPHIRSKEPNCPECTSQRVWRDGLRRTAYGDVQRWICRECGYRFSENGSQGPLKNSSKWSINSASAISSNRQVCELLTEDSKNLATVETRIQEKAAGATEKTDGKILEFAWHMKKRNLSEATIKMRVQRLNQLVGMGADLTNPDSVETVLATEEMSPAKKRFLVQSYKSFTKLMGISWEAIKVRYEPKQPFIPLEQEINQLIAGCRKRTATFLQIAKDTGARAGEIVRLQWIDVNTKDSTVAINNPLKGSKSRTIKVSDKTIAMINAMPKQTDFIFGLETNRFEEANGKKRSIQCTFIRQRNRLAITLQNPRLKQIHFHTLRHWFATMQYHKTRDINRVKYLLGHKYIANTEIYMHLVNFESDEWHSATAKTVEEAQKLIEVGFEYVCEMQEVKLFRKRK